MPEQDLATIALGTYPQAQDRTLPHTDHHAVSTPAMTRSASLRSVLFLSIGLVTNANAQSFEQRAQVYMDSTYYADTTMVGLLVHVEAPDRSISWTGVSGRSEKGGAALQPKAPFLIASNIKTYVSATILRLVEEHQLNLNDPVGPLITEKSRALFTSDGYDLQAITLRHLLSHTSGLDSYTGYGYIDSIAAHPIHRYFA